MGLLGKLFGKKPRDEAATPTPQRDANDTSEAGNPNAQSAPDIAPELALALNAFQAGRRAARGAAGRCGAPVRAVVLGDEALPGSVSLEVSSKNLPARLLEYLQVC